MRKKTVVISKDVLDFEGTTVAEMLGTLMYCKMYCGQLCADIYEEDAFNDFIEDFDIYDVKFELLDNTSKKSNPNWHTRVVVCDECSNDPEYLWAVTLADVSDVGGREDTPLMVKVDKVEETREQGHISRTYFCIAKWYLSMDDAELLLASKEGSDED